MLPDCDHNGWTCTQAGCFNSERAEDQRRCDHEGCAPDGCDDCGMVFIYCNGCSEISGGSVRHAPPACKDDALEAQP